MKLFGELRSCWGGATVMAAAETATATSKTTVQHEEVGRGGYNHATMAQGFRRARSTNTTTSRNWKPKLYKISEERVLSDLERRVGSDDNFSGKVKDKPKSKDPSPSHGEDYWKSSSLWALPAFSPAPFAF